MPSVRTYRPWHHTVEPKPAAETHLVLPRPTGDLMSCVVSVPLGRRHVRSRGPRPRWSGERSIYLPVVRTDKLTDDRPSAITKQPITNAAAISGRTPRSIILVGDIDRNFMSRDRLDPSTSHRSHIPSSSQFRRCSSRVNVRCGRHLTPMPPGGTMTCETTIHERRPKPGAIGCIFLQPLQYETNARTASSSMVTSRSQLMSSRS